MRRPKGSVVQDGSLNKDDLWNVKDKDTLIDKRIPVAYKKNARMYLHLKFKVL